VGQGAKALGHEGVQNGEDEDARRHEVEGHETSAGGENLEEATTGHRWVLVEGQGEGSAGGDNGLEIGKKTSKKSARETP